MDTINGDLGDLPLILGIHREFIIDYDSLSDLFPHYKFSPKEEELVRDYLWPKVQGQQLPLNRIMDIYDIKAHTAQQLYEMNKPKRGVECYFFTSRNKHSNGNKSKKTACNGVWKPNAGEDPIRSHDGTDQILGYKRALVFHEGKAPNQTKTDWRMHEYTLAKYDTARTPTAPLCGMPMKLDEWVLCKIYQTKKATKKSDKKNHEDDQEMQVPPNNEELLQNGGTPRNIRQYADNRGMQPGTQWNIQQYEDSQGMQPGINPGEFPNAQPQYAFPKLPPRLSEINYNDYTELGDSYLNGSEDDDMFRYLA